MEPYTITEEEYEVLVEEWCSISPARRRALREACDLTQQELAEHLGCVKSMVGEYERTAGEAVIPRKSNPQVFSVYGALQDLALRGEIVVEE